jgi:hypothetical protein
VGRVERITEMKSVHKFLVRKVAEKIRFNVYTYIKLNQDLEIKYGGRARRHSANLRYNPQQ